MRSYPGLGLPPSAYKVNEPATRCPLCKAIRGSSSCFKAHIRCTGESDDKVYHCRICKTKSKRRDSLHKHLRMHTGDRPFVCPNCPYRAHTYIDVVGHIIRKHKSEYLTFLVVNSTGSVPRIECIYTKRFSFTMRVLGYSNLQSCQTLVADTCHQ